MKKLRNRLVLMPTLMIAIVSLAAILLFNIVFIQYTDRQIEGSINNYKEYHMAIDRIQNEYDALLEKGFIPASEKMIKLRTEMELLTKEYRDTYSAVTTQMVVLDDQYVAEYATASEKKIVNYYRNNTEQVLSEGITEIEVDDESYCISTASIRVAGSDEKKDVIIYTDISTINALTDAVNRVLILVLCISALIAFLVGFSISRNIAGSITQLRLFLEQIKTGDEVRDKTGIQYAELKELADYMEGMSDELTASQMLQKVIFQNASHELRTPLMSIQGYAEGISTNVLKDHKSAADIIITESKKMSELVDEMLYISRMDENPINEEDMSVIELRPVIEDCREEICVIGEKKGAVIIESLDGGDYYIRGDEKQITKALRNVMSNGIRYAKEKLAITGSVEDGKITIMITDDGNGISEKDLPHVFDRFYKGEGGNFGIGLSVTRDIIERHKGTIEAVNLEKGARFIITLPAVEVDHKPEETDVISGGMLTGDVDLEEILKNIPEEDRQL